MRQIYLDYNATTPVAPSVFEAMSPFFTEYFGNPSSSHALGRACQEAIEDARSQVAEMLGADPDEIVFTGGGSESNNLALKGIMMRGGAVTGGHLIISSIEHPAISEPAAFLERIGFDLSVVPCDHNGRVDPQAIADELRIDTLLVSVMHANNEIGTVQSIREIAEICHSQEVLLHTDAAQSIGKIRTVVDELDVDLLSIAGHKLYAPKGVGALFVRSGIDLEPLIHGAGHEAGLRAGTENTPYIVGLGKASLLAMRGLDEGGDRLAMLRDRLCGHLVEALGDRISINAQQATRLPNTLSVNFSGVSGYDLLKRTPEICASTGAACHSGSTAMSPTQASIGMTAEQVRGCVRLSVGTYTSEEEIDRAASLLISAYESLAE